MPNEKFTNDEETVYAYYGRMLGMPPSDQTLKELPCISGCGEDCVKAIDAAAAWIAHHRAAFGNHRQGALTDMIDATDNIVTCYWRG